MTHSKQRKSLLFLAAAVAMGAAAQHASAANCIQDLYKDGGGNGSLNCKSNDVKLGRVNSITNVSGIRGTFPNQSCVAGAPVEFTADFEVELGASGGARYDVGVFVAQGQSQALTGACNASVITGKNAANFDQEDSVSQPDDTCGDISGARGSLHNPQLVHLDIKTTCMEGGGGKLLLPNCTSWRQPGSNGVCTGIEDAFPGSPSKCNCDNGFTVEIAVEHPALQVSEAVNPTQLPWPGGKVGYTVTVHNPTVGAPITLTKLSDDQTNDGIVDRSFDATTAPGLPAICLATELAPCGPDPDNCNPASTTTCSYTGDISGNQGDSVTDRACVTGEYFGNALSACATASASIKDVAPTAAVTKTFVGAVCGVIRYEVKVENTDPAEPLSLTSLMDDRFGDITRERNVATNPNSPIYRTDCTVPMTIGVKNQAVPSSGQYQCSFDALVCDFPHSNTVTGTLTDGSTSITKTGSSFVGGIYAYGPRVIGM